MSKLKFAVIGTGGVGGGRIRQISQRPDAEVVAISDVSEEAMQRHKEALGDVATYLDWREMLDAHKDLDAAVVASPHTAHTDQVRECLERGLHVLVEKPMTTTAADARLLTELSEQKGKTLAIGYQRHGEARYRECRRLLQEGAIGEIKLITVLIAQDCHWLFSKNEDGSYRSWRANPALSGGGHLMDTGSHIVDMLLWLTGLEPKRVASFVNNHDCDVDVFTASTVEFTNGCVGTLATTSIAADGWREEFTFYGEQGMLTVRDDGIRYQKQGGDLIWPKQFRDPGKDPLTNFVEAVQGASEVQAPPVCGLRVVQFTETAYKSAATGQIENAG
jgi:predicted dehydrogenase